MPQRAIFVDTWGWLALGHRRDPHHLRVKEVFAQWQSQGQPVHTSDYVLDELISLLFRREKQEEAIRFMDAIIVDQLAGRLQIQRVTTERFFAAMELRKRFQ